MSGSTKKIKEDFVVVKFEDFMKKCDYRWKHNFKEYCAHEPREDKIECSIEGCPLIYYSVEEIRPMPLQKSPYVV